MSSYGVAMLGLGSLFSVLGVALLRNREHETELFHRIASGDAQALKTLYAQVSSRVLAMAVRLLRDRSEAEDVVQDTFLEVWRRAAQYEASRGGADAWVLTIARSRAIDRLRAQGSSVRAAQGASNEPPASGPLAPFELAGQHESRERVLAALAALPAEQREVIELSYFDGLTQSEIAERTSKPLGTVKSRVRTAMTKLGELLGGEAQGLA